jgi:tRNA (guanine-N7-)-methyltransferase
MRVAFANWFRNQALQTVSPSATRTIVPQAHFGALPLTCARDLAGRNTMKRSLETSAAPSSESSAAAASSSSAAAATAAVPSADLPQDGPPLKRSTNKVGSNCAIIDKAMKDTYGVLKLEETGVKADIGPTRTRNHINPLQTRLQIPHDKLDWTTVFADPTKPLAVDVGCAAGRFSLMLAKHGEFTEYNHLGMEIRGTLCLRANAWAQTIGLADRTHFMTASANSSLKHVLSDYPGPIQLICIQYPDPHFKRKHHKRRVLQAPLVNDIIEVLNAGGKLFLQSDVEEIAAEMRDRVDVYGESLLVRDGEYTPRSESLNQAACAKGDIKNECWTRDGKRSVPGGPDYGDWRIGENPLGVPTEREVANLSLGNAVYRAYYTRMEGSVKPVEQEGSAAPVPEAASGAVADADAVADAESKVSTDAAAVGSGDGGDEGGAGNVEVK